MVSCSSLLALPDSLSLPSAGYTRQTGFCRVLHSANATRQSLPRQRNLCRVSNFGHSAKTLLRALALGKAATWRHPGPALCRVPNGGHSAKFQTFAECRRLALGKVPAQGGATWPLCRVLHPGTRQTFETLPSARVLALGKVLSCCHVEGHFA